MPGLAPSRVGLGGFPGWPGSGGLGAFLGGAFSLPGGEGAPGFDGMPLGPRASGAAALFLAFLCAEGVGEGDEENDLDLERLPLKELCWEEWLEYELKDEVRERDRDEPEPV